MQYDKVSTPFLDDAPIRIVLKATLPVSPQRLFEIFKDPDSWGWATITRVVWETPQPYGPGTTRTVTIDGQGDVQEYFLRWEEGCGMTFRFEQGDMKSVSALVEDYAVTPIGESECELTWTIGMRLRGLLRLASPLLAGAMRKQFGKMLDDLGREMAGHA